MATGALDANGVWIYGEDDPASPVSDLLNLGMDSVSDVVGDAKARLTTLEAGPGAWTAYTPALLGISLGNGTLSAATQSSGPNTLDLSVSLTFGSTTTYSGGAGAAIGISLPPGMTALRSQALTADIFDASTGFDYLATGRILAGSSVISLALQAGFVASVNDSRPFAWAVGDWFMLTGRIELA